MDPIERKVQRWELSVFGPVIPGVLVAIHPVAGKLMKQAGQPIPDPLRLQGLIDTGSEVCALRRELAKQLGLMQVGTENLFAAHGHAREVPLYYARLIFPNGLDYKTRLIGAELSRQVPLLIGRDLLERCVFSYDGLAGSFSLRVGHGRK